MVSARVLCQPTLIWEESWGVNECEISPGLLEFIGLLGKVTYCRCVLLSHNVHRNLASQRKGPLQTLPNCSLYSHRGRAISIHNLCISSTCIYHFIIEGNESGVGRIKDTKTRSHPWLLESVCSTGECRPEATWSLECCRTLSSSDKVLEHPFPDVAVLLCTSLSPCRASVSCKTKDEKIGLIGASSVKPPDSKT